MRIRSVHPFLKVFRLPDDLPREQWAPTHPLGFTYVFWGKSRNRPFYVGYTWDPGYRLKTHQNKPWFDEAKSVWVASYPTEEEARNAERNLIIDLNPIHNIKRPRV